MKTRRWMVEISVGGSVEMVKPLLVAFVRSAGGRIIEHVSMDGLVYQAYSLAYAGETCQAVQIWLELQQLPGGCVLISGEADLPDGQADLSAEQQALFEHFAKSLRARFAACE